MPETIDAKIISEIPLPIPRWVISSPNHMIITQPAVRQVTIRKTRPKVKFSTTWSDPVLKERKRKT